MLLWCHRVASGVLQGTFPVLYLYFPSIFQVLLWFFVSTFYPGIFPTFSKFFPYPFAVIPQTSGVFFHSFALVYLIKLIFAHFCVFFLHFSIFFFA